MQRPAPLILAVLGLLALPLQAQEAALGLRVQALMPMGDLRDLTNGQTGIGLAGFVEIPIGDAFRLRPTVGGQYFPNKDSLSLAGAQVTVSSVDLMLDALWFPGETPDQGPYLVGGLGAQMWRISPAGGNATSATRLGVTGGIGYQLSTHLAGEIRGFWSPVETNLTATGVSLGGVVRF